MKLSKVYKLYFTLKKMLSIVLIWNVISKFKIRKLTKIGILFASMIYYLSKYISKILSVHYFMTYMHAYILSIQRRIKPDVDEFSTWIKYDFTWNIKLWQPLKSLILKNLVAFRNLYNILWQMISKEIRTGVLINVLTD